MPASSGLFRPRGLAQPCPAFPSLPQLTPARPGPRSLAQLPRGPGRVPIIQGAFQRSYRAQEPWQCPGMCPGGAHGHIHFQSIGTVPRLKNSVWKHLEKTLSWTFYFFYLTFKSKSLVFTFVSQEVSHIGFLLPVSHVCLQIAFPVSHIGFTISPNFDNLTVKWNWRLICSCNTCYFVCGIELNISLFPIDFNGKPEIFLKHSKKKNFFLKGMCVCDWTLIIFQDSLTLHYLMSTLFFLKKKKFFLCVYFNTNNLKVFSCQPCVTCVSHVEF